MEQKYSRLFLISFMWWLLATSTFRANAQTKTNDSITDIFKEMNLEEVVVKGTLPTVKFKANSLEARIAGTDLEHAGTLEDVLGKTPGMYKQGEELQVIGKGSPIYYINGRRIQDAAELQRISSEQVRSVEVINNPGSDYAADVRAVVKIKLKPAQGEGFSLDTKADVCQSLVRGGTDPGTNLSMNYRYKGWDFFGGSHLGYSRYYQHGEIGGVTSLKRLNHEQKGILDTDFINRLLQLHFGTNWQINSHHTIGFMMQTTRTLYNNEKTTIDETVWRDGVFEDHIISASTCKLDGQNSFTTNTYYNGQMGNVNVDWNVDIVNNHIRKTNATTEQSLIQDSEFWTKTDTRNRMTATKLVLTYPYRKSEFKVGAEVYRVRNGNKQATSSEVIMNSESEVTETTTATFASYSLSSSIGQWSVGLRYEHVNMDYQDKVNAIKNNVRQQDNFFPSISWSQTFGNFGLSANYSIKTRRPNYWQLRDVTRYHSRYIYESGNAQLQNTINQTLSLMGNYHWLTCGIEYLNAAHKILDWGEPYNEQGVILLKTRNLEKPVNSMTVYVLARPKIGCWSPNYTFAFTKQFFTLDFHDEFAPTGIRTASFNKPMFYLNANNSFRFDTPKHNPWQFEVNMQLRSSMNHDNDYIRRSILSLEAAVQKSYLNGNLTFRLSANDLLQKMKEDLFVDFGVFSMTQYLNRQRQSLTFSVHYRLNATKSNYRGSGAGGDAKNRMQTM